MKRNSLRGGLAALLVALPFAVNAQPYPNQDIHFICAFPAGSGADVLVRYFAEKVRPLSGKNILVENKVGANGEIAAEYTVRSKPDGYTIYVHAASTVAANHWLLKKPPINVGEDLQIAGGVNQQPFMIAVAMNSPYKTVADLTEGMKKKGNKASFAESNVTGKVVGALYKLATGVEAEDISYRTANDMLNDFQSGAIDYGIVDPVFALIQQREGRIRNLAVVTPSRMGAVPELPTMVELGFPNIHVSSWFAAMVPSATPRPVVDQINAWFNQVGAMDETRRFLNKFGGDPLILTPDEGQKRLLSDIKDWGEYVKAAKIEPQS
ncbi:MAG: Bug family tripartite tricarboxylate transporter substrate binding protein [Xanthobacteraceae bacterium]